MRSFIKKNAMQPQRPQVEARRFSQGREIAMPELSHVLGMPAEMLRIVTDAASFPAPLGKRYHGERVWLLADVADYFDRIGWPEDARALREWGG